MRSLALLCLLALPTLAQQPVAPTNALTPDDERKSFKLPPGFAAQLVASEPEIQKPIQLAFDAKGRLWVTTSYHYPFAAEKGKESDKLFVLSDFGPDGKAKTVQVFDDHLNIPIGILPLPDCKSCIVSSVGEILKLTDTDGDGKADKREVLFTGFGSKDTHGMYNSFTYLPDGWVYACHGFSNDSHVKGKDGHEVHMQSGNTFRFRPDGSRIEIYTRGQVNPFGMTVDPWFNLYTADCHSKPITQLIKGAYYDSFGKPHDGLGYAPHVTRHDHGSTALCGLSWYDADQFPAEWGGCMFLGNVVTNRINADKIEWHGSTPVAKELPDFLVSGDPWFRPSDIKLGPDGALYVADFYNKIIGHYEVDLKHPGRDKTRGRVWRIIWQGKDGKAEAPKMPADPTTATIAEVYRQLDSRNITVRLAAVHQLVRRWGARRGSDEFNGAADTTKAAGEPKTVEQLTGLLADNPTAQTTEGNAFASWSNARTPTGMRYPLEKTDGKLGAVFWLRQAATLPTWADSKASPRKEVLGVVARHVEVLDWRAGKRGEPDAAIALLGGEPSTGSYQTVRAAVDALIAHPHADNIDPLLKLVAATPAEDAALKHAARVALRNALAADESQTELVWLLQGQIGSGLPPAKVLDDVFLGVPTAYAGWWLSERLKAGTLDPAVAERAYQHVGRYGCDCHRQVAFLAAEQIADKKIQFIMLNALQRGTQSNGGLFKPSESTQLVRQVADGLTSREDSRVIQSFQLAPTIGFDPSKAALAIVPDAGRSEAVRLAALTALEKQPKDQVLPLCGPIVADAAAPAGLKEKAISLLASSTKLNDLILLTDQLRTAPHRQSVLIATALAGSKDGANQLFAAVKLGKASARLLQEKVVLDRLKATNADKWQERVKELTAGLPTADARIAALLKERGDGYKKAKIDLDAGKRLFAATCANCHQIGGQGAKVGPQLDGIGNRGVERLMEDVLDPNRNVDHAFYTTTLELKDGRQLSGLLRTEGKTLILIDPQAKETRVAEDEVEKQRTSPLSPMPSDIAEKLKPQDFYHLIGYLADLRQK